MSKITFLGNFNVNYTSESHHAKSLETLGHEVIRLQEGQASTWKVITEAKKSDLFVVIHTHGWETPGSGGLEFVLQSLKGTVPTLTYHLDLWLGLERQKDLDNDPFYKLIDYAFYTDKLMADWFSKNTNVKAHYLPAGVFDAECYLLNTYEQENDVIFVGSKGYHPEWPWRPQLIDWLSNTYKERFRHYGNDGIRVVRGYELNELYANSKIAIGDTLCLNYNYPYYFSDRLFESTGRGAFTIFPYIKGIEKYFELGIELITYEYGNFKDLEDKIDYYLENDKAREAIRRAGHERTKNNHTYYHRWQEILNKIV